MPEGRPHSIAKTALLTLLVAGGLGAAVGLTIWRAGWYNIGATKPHFQIVYSGLETAMHYSVRRHARDIAVPALGEAEALRGAAVYRDNCAFCHGAPGLGPSTPALSMQPAPGPLVDAGMRWQSRELYWITRHGIKMSGMPAWEFHLSEADIWATVAFIERLPDLSVQEYQALTAAAPTQGQAQ